MGNTIVKFDDDFYDLESWLPEKAIDEFVNFVISHSQSLEITEEEFESSDMCDRTIKYPQLVVQKYGGESIQSRNIKPYREVGTFSLDYELKTAQSEVA